MTTRIPLSVVALLLIAMSHGQDAVLADGAKSELIAASDASAPKSLAEISKESSDAVAKFTKATMGAGFTEAQRSYVTGLFLLTDAATIERLNHASPRNFRLPVGLVTIAGEALLPFDLTSDALNYSWCRGDLLAMKVLKRAASDFPAPKAIEEPKVTEVLTKDKK